MSNCPICQNKEFKTFTKGYSYCTKCAFIKQDNPVEINYTKEKRTTKHTIHESGEKIMSKLKNTNARNELIIEVGSNDGTFMNMLNQAGFFNVVGIEPSKELVKLSKKNKHIVEEGYLTERLVKRIIKKYGTAKVVICRHVLEHVPNPTELIQLMRKLLDSDGTLIIEVPETRNIILRLNFRELIDQHLNYFTENNLRAFLNLNGFEIKYTELSNLLDTEVTTVYCSKNIEVQGCGAFRKRLKESLAILQRNIKKINKPIAILGASHPQVSFVKQAGIKDYVNVMLDDDPQKITMNGEISAVISTEQFIQSQKNTVIKCVILNTAFGYPEWAKRIKERLPEIRIIELEELWE